MGYVHLGDKVHPSRLEASLKVRIGAGDRIIAALANYG
jgi:hypothetical protein